MSTMTKTKVQVPVNTTVLKKSKDRAEKLGFTSLNEVIRIMLAKFSDGSISVGIVDHDYDKQKELYEKELERQELIADEEVKRGVRKSYTDIHELVSDLNA